MDSISFAPISQRVVTGLFSSRTLSTVIMAARNEKDRILDAAFDVFSGKGYIKANIAEIARKADVPDSKIYKYFSSKEDLLYAVPLKAMQSITRQVKNELRGIRDVTSLLSKYIFIQLDFAESNPDITRITLECRSHEGWYHSDAYKAIRAYGSVLQGILERGIDEGVFRDDVSPRLLLNVIFGTTDFEHLSLLIHKEIDSQIDDLDDILDLILPMLEKRSGMDQSRADKASRILSAAEQIFSQFGFVKAKVLDIAEQANVSEGTVYEYFKTKEDLLLAVTSKHMTQHLQRLDDAFEIKHPLRKLRRLIRYHFTLYLANRDFLKVFILNTQLRTNFYESTAFTLFQRYHKLIEDIVEQGKSEGVFRSNVNPRIFRNLFLGAFSHISIRWFILESRPQVDMMREIDQLTDMLSISLLTETALQEFLGTHT